MAGKKQKPVPGSIKDRTIVTYVPKAGAWCVTTFKKGVQTQAWSPTKP